MSDTPNQKKRSRAETTCQSKRTNIPNRRCDQAMTRSEPYLEQFKKLRCASIARAMRTGRFAKVASFLLLQCLFGLFLCISMFVVVVANSGLRTFPDDVGFVPRTYEALHREDVELFLQPQRRTHVEAVGRTLVQGHETSFTSA